MASTSSSKELSASNARAQLSLSLPSSTCVVGSVLRPVVKLEHDAHYTSTSLKMVGETRATIMGKERWQAGVIANASLGGGAMGAAGMPITSIERLKFVEMEIPLVSSSTAAIGDVKRPEKIEPTSSSSPTGDSRLTCEFTLLPPPEDQLLPALAPRDFDMTTVSVTWTLKFVGVRKGLLRRNDTLSFDLPVAFPTPQLALPSTVSLTQAFKFDTGANQGMTLQADLSATPITYRSRIPFELVLSPSSSSAAHLLTTSSTPLKVEASLSRHVRTTPIANPNSGRSFEWAGVRIAMVSLKKSKENDWKWEGTMTLPEADCTVESKGVAVSYNLNCHVISPVLAQAALHISLTIFIPSSPIEATAPPPADVSGNDLPAYAVS